MFNEGNLTITTTGRYGPEVGGIFGELQRETQANTMSNSGALNVTSDGESAKVGGLIGYAGGAVICTTGINTGTIMATAKGYAYCGGFIGYIDYDITIDIKSDQSTGKVTAKSTNIATNSGASWAGIRVGCVGVDRPQTQASNQETEGTPGSIDGVEAIVTSSVTKSYVNGILTSDPAS